jgi:hypothetical protein
MRHAFEVIRRGEEEKEIIVPLTGEMPKPRDEPTPPRVTLDDAQPPPGSDSNKPGASSSIPLE